MITKLRYYDHTSAIVTVLQIDAKKLSRGDIIQIDTDEYHIVEFTFIDISRRIQYAATLQLQPIDIEKIYNESASTPSWSGFQDDVECNY